MPPRRAQRPLLRTPAVAVRWDPEDVEHHDSVVLPRREELAWWCLSLRVQTGEMFEFYGDPLPRV